MNDLYTQLDYMVHEMKTDPYERKMAFSRLERARNLEEAMMGMGAYERYNGWRGGRTGGGETGRRYILADEYEAKIEAGAYNRRR